MFKCQVYGLLALMLLPSLFASASSEQLIKLYHDADWSNHKESAQSILQGVETALGEWGGSVQGYRIVLVKKDHSGNVIRSHKNMMDFMADPQALAIISGIHSAPLIKNRQFINDNKLLTLVPWAAGAPITRFPSAENWVFRLSVDDTKAAEVLVNFALNDKSCKVPHLLLENTPWGDSNADHMFKALHKYGHSLGQISRFEWGIKSYTARDKLEQIYQQGADCILLAANTLEGIEIAKAMASRPYEQRLPLISHWGITAGYFHRVIDEKVRAKIDLSFIQSCFSFMQQPLSVKGGEVFQQAKHQFPDDIVEPIDILSPAGFVHGYDITLLMLNALNQIKLGDDMAKNREALRLSLESLTKPIRGLLKVYEKPFDVFSQGTPDAHEALNISDYCMARYDKNGAIILMNNE